MKKSIVFYGCLMISSFLYSSPQKVLIWDLGGVLFSNSKLTYVSSIGFKPIVSYMLTERTAPWRFSKQVQYRVFEVLSKVPVDEHATEASSCIPGGIMMPPLLWAFQAGLVEAKDCISRAQDTIADLHVQGYFKNFAEKELIEKIICAAFDTSLSVSSCSVRTETMKLVKHLASLKQKDGTNRYKLVVLSNWDPWSFAHIRKKFSSELSYFDDVIISGDIQLMKPMHKIFQHVIEKHQVAKEDCIFIDDQEENIKGARAFGIKHPIHFKNSMCLRQQLRRLRIL